MDIKCPFVLEEKFTFGTYDPDVPVQVWSNLLTLYSRAREIVGFAGSGPIFETENRFISGQEA